MGGGGHTAGLPDKAVCTQKQHSAYARAVYSRPAVTRKAQGRVLRLRLCLGSPKAKVNAKRLTRRLRARYKLRKADNRYLGQLLAAKRGWTGAQWHCLEALWSRESGWNHRISNAGGSGAYGIPQALPGSKMSSAGRDWATNPATQIRWGLGYIAGRYGTPCGANGFQSANGFY